MQDRRQEIAGQLAKYREMYERSNSGRFSPMVKNESKSWCIFNQKTGQVEEIQIGIIGKNLTQVIVAYAHELAEAELRAPYLYLDIGDQKENMVWKLKKMYIALRIDFRAIAILASWSVSRAAYGDILKDEECTGFINKVRCFLFKKVLRK